jgi:hypothetical protein
MSGRLERVADLGGQILLLRVLLRHRLLLWSEKLVLERTTAVGGFLLMRSRGSVSPLLADRGGEEER